MQRNPASSRQRVKGGIPQDISSAEKSIMAQSSLSKFPSAALQLLRSLIFRDIREFDPHNQFAAYSSR
jgi:hypothetical protein